MNWIKVAPGKIHKYPKNFLMRSYDGYTALITESSIFVFIKDNTGRIQKMSKEHFFSQPHAIKEFLPL